MEIRIEDKIVMNKKEIPTEMVGRLKKDLTLLNPEYIKRKKIGKSVWKIQQFISLYEEQGSNVIIPRGYLSKLNQLLSQYQITSNLEDSSITLPTVTFSTSSHFALRDYQSTAITNLLKHCQGGLVAPCGSGKTIMMLEVIARLGQPALIITHTKELLMQTIKRAVEMLKLEESEIGILGNGKYRLGDKLTVGLVQTLSRRDLSDIRDKFGVVFVDEAHHLVARQFYKVVNQLPAKFRYWVSATPKREDGLTEMIYTTGGPIVYQVKRECLPTIVPSLEVIETEFLNGADNYNELIKKIVKDKKRNALIVSTILKNTKNNYSLVLSNRIEHLDVLKEMLKKRSHLRIEVLTGNLRDKEREAIMKRALNKEIDILLSTQLAREGLDLPHLDRLFLATPKKAAASVEQEIGRIMRPSPGKRDAIVFDFWDNKCPMVKGQFFKRRKVYQNLSMTN